MGGHHHHDHAHGANERSVGLAAGLTGAFMLAEVAGGIVSGSLALLADAGHMLTDFASLALAWVGFRLARRPASGRMTYGFGRFSVLVAFVNGLALFVIAAWIGVEAWRRFSEPVEVMGGLMLGVAAAGLLVNVFAFWVLQHGDKTNLNIRAAAAHVAGDLLGSVAAIAASVVIIFTGWTPIDPILSVVVALIILRAAWSVTRDSAHILLEGGPPDVDAAAIGARIVAAAPDVEDVHHVHVWSITQERPMATLHARVRSGADRRAAASAIKAVLRDDFGVGHATVEIEDEEGCATAEDAPALSGGAAT